MTSPSSFNTSYIDQSFSLVVFLNFCLPFGVCTSWLHRFRKSCLLGIRHLTHHFSQLNCNDELGRLRPVSSRTRLPCAPQLSSTVSSTYLSLDPHFPLVFGMPPTCLPRFFPIFLLVISQASPTYLNLSPSGSLFVLHCRINGESWLIIGQLIDNFILTSFSCLAVGLKEGRIEH